MCTDIYYKLFMTKRKCEISPGIHRFLSHLAHHPGRNRPVDLNIFTLTQYDSGQIKLFVIFIMFCMLKFP